MNASLALKAELAQDLRAERFDVTPDGLYFPRQSVLAAGEYFDRVNGGAWGRQPNRIVKEGLIHILNVALGTTPKPAGYFLALSSGATAPADNWTASSYAAVAGEIVSLTEGHTGATRPVWTPANAAANASIDNMATATSLTIATTGTLTVTGAALLTNNVRGGTSGVLVSAALYAAPRTFQNGDTYELGYRINLTV